MEYVPGDRNIGPRGRKLRYTQTITGFTVLLVMLSAIPELLSQTFGVFAVFALVYYSFYNFIQAEKGFCGTYAALGYHRGSDGVEHTDDPEAKAVDRNESLKQNIHSAAAGLIFTGWTLILFLI